MSVATTFGSGKTVSVFQNVDVRGGLFAKHATMLGDLRLNAAHSNYSNLIMGRGAGASALTTPAGVYVGGGASANSAPAAFSLAGSDPLVQYALEIQDGGEIIVEQIPLAASTYTLVAPLQVAGMHYWSVAPSGSGAMQFDSMNNKFVFAQLTNSGYHEAGTPDQLSNGRMALEAGALISNVTADPSDLDTATVPQLILQNGAEKWRIALVTDNIDGVLKLSIQRFVGLGSSATSNPSCPWETVTNFVADDQLTGASQFTSATAIPLEFGLVAAA